MCRQTRSHDALASVVVVLRVTGSRADGLKPAPWQRVMLRDSTSGTLGLAQLRGVLSQLRGPIGPWAEPARNFAGWHQRPNEIFKRAQLLNPSGTRRKAKSRDLPKRHMTYTVTLTDTTQFIQCSCRTEIEVRRGVY